MRATPGSRGWRIVLDLGTAVLVAAALGLVIHDRVLPEIRRRAEVEVGEPLPREMRYRLLASGETVAAARPGPAVHLVFQSSCPACRRTVPRWRELMGARPGLRAYAVGVEEDEARALDYVRRRLPEALAVRPAAEPSYLRLLRIRVVPTTLLTDAKGRLRWRKDGILGAADVEAILARLDSRAADSGPRATHQPSTGGRRP